MTNFSDNLPEFEEVTSSKLDLHIFKIPPTGRFRRAGKYEYPCMYCGDKVNEIKLEPILMGFFAQSFYCKKSSIEKAKELDTFNSEYRG